MLLLSCSPKIYLKDFKSDGCSLFPDKNYIKGPSWCECCVEHDYAYWKGGTEEERKIADQKLKKCIEEKTHDPVFANLIYIGVRAGGLRYFPSWYRWGYGWPYGSESRITDDIRKKEIEKKGEVDLDKIKKCICE